MKKYIILIFFILILSACFNQELSKEADVLINIDLDDYDYIGTFMNGDELYIESYRYNMQDAAWSMIILRDNLLYKMFEGMPSKPKFNKERTKILYIDNLQFEAVGNVTIYDSVTEKETRYTDFDYGSSKDTVKDVDWFTEEVLFCIVGFSVGTVSQGGELYTLDIGDRELILIDLEDVISAWTNYPYEIVDVYVEEGGLKFLLVEWYDDNFEDYYYTSHTLTFETIERLGLLEGSYIDFN